MELSEICRKTLENFKVDSVKDLSEVLFTVCKENDIEKIKGFADIVQDLSIDWLQKIFQYYEADRKDKKQDFTPKSLAELVGLLVGDDTEIVDMCAGSGALTIQKWNQNKNSTFKRFELDEKVIPYLAFNMILRNIECEIYHADVLSNEIFHVYKIEKSESFGRLKELVQCQA